MDGLVHTDTHLLTQIQTQEGLTHTHTHSAYHHLLHSEINEHSHCDKTVHCKSCVENYWTNFSHQTAEALDCCQAITILFTACFKQKYQSSHLIVKQRQFHLCCCIVCVCVCVLPLRDNGTVNNYIGPAESSEKNSNKRLLRTKQH